VKDDFLYTAKKYTAICTDADPLFTEVTALQILGLAIGRNVPHVIQPSKLYHNSYVALLGQSGKSRKNTVQELMKPIVPQELWLPSEASPEALLKEMSEQNNGIQWAGEWSKELRGIKTGNYMASMAEVKNDLFGCRCYRKKLVEKEYVIEEPFLCVNTTLVPEVLQDLMTTDMANGGYVGRFITPLGKSGDRPRGRLASEAEHLLEILMNNWVLVSRLDKENCQFEFTDEALEYYNTVVAPEIESVRYAKANAMRYMDYVITFADLVMVSEAIGNTISETHELVKLVELIQLVKLVDSKYKGSITNSSVSYYSTNSTNSTKAVLLVQKHHLVESWRILKPCLQFADEIVAFAEIGKAVARGRRWIKEHGSDGNKVWHSDLMRNANLNSKEVELVIDTLVQRGEIYRDREERQGRYTVEQVPYYTWRGGI
jgi:hypothetical protein